MEIDYLFPTGRMTLDVRAPSLFSLIFPEVVIDMATVRMGNPPQNFQLLIDSGSADLWVGGEGCHGTDGGDCVKIAFSCSFLESDTHHKLGSSQILGIKF